MCRYYVILSFLAVVMLGFKKHLNFSYGLYVISICQRNAYIPLLRSSASFKLSIVSLWCSRNILSILRLRYSESYQSLRASSMMSRESTLCVFSQIDPAVTMLFRNIYDSHEHEQSRCTRWINDHNSLINIVSISRLYQNYIILYFYWIGFSYALVPKCAAQSPLPV